MLGNVVGKGGGGAFGLSGYAPKFDGATYTKSAETASVGDTRKETFDALQMRLGIGNRYVMGERHLEAMSNPAAYHRKRIQKEKEIANSLGPVFATVEKELQDAGFPADIARDLAEKKVFKKFHKDVALMEDLYPTNFFSQGLQNIRGESNKIAENAARDAKGDEKSVAESPVGGKEKESVSL